MRLTRRQLTSALAAFLILGLSLFAGGPLNLNPGDPDGVERWAAGGVGIPFNRDLGGLGPLTNAAADTLVRDAFDAWEFIPTATATYVDGGDLAVDIDATNFIPFVLNLFTGTNTSDGLSPIAYDADGSIFAALFGPGTGVLGFASPDTFDAMGVPIEGVAFLNGGSILGGFPVADFFGVTVHEFGHYSGLAHTVVNGQIAILGDTSGPTPDDPFGPLPATPIETMYPFAIIGGGEETPHLDDISIYSFLYPSATFFSTVGSIGGTIFGVDGVTPLVGVNVICRNPLDPFVDAASAISGDRGIAGEWKIKGLTAGADYRCFTDEILAGGFSTTPLSPLPGPEEYYNGASESNDGGTDVPSDFVDIPTTAGVHTTGIDIIFNSPAPGVPLPLGDDNSIQVPLPFTVSICGQNFNSVFINSNGSLTFGFGDADFTESAAEHLTGPPRVAGLWDDLSPNNGGTVSFSSSRNIFSVRWEDVPEFFSTGANTFEIVLKKSSDHIDLNYEGITATDGLAGVSCGGAIASGFETETDLSALAPRRINIKNTTAFFEQFTGDNDLANSTVRFTGTSSFSDDFEENDAIATASSIALPFNTIDSFTSIDPVGDDVDYFRFSGNAGQTLVAEILTGSLDSVMGLFQITGPGTGTLIATDDDGGAGLLSRLVVPLPADADYAIAVSAFADFDFDGDGNSGGRYVLEAFLIDGILIDLGDDDSEEVTLGFSFPFRGTSYGSVFVGSNGFLTFGSGDTDFSESVSELLSDQPRIAGLWDDLSPNNGGLILADGDASSMTISFIDVPEFVSTGANSFAFTLFSDGSVDIDYGDLTASDGLAGCSEGGGAADPGETDLSAAVTPLSGSGTTYEIFTAGDNDLANTLIMFSP